MAYTQPSIEVFGLLIQEPVTTITDLMVSAVCYYAFFKLSKNKNQTKLKNYLRFYFLSMALATTIGGLIGHAFLYAFSFSWKLPGWLTSMVSIALLERAVIEYLKPIISKNLGRLFLYLNFIELITFMTITFYTLNFFFVEVHSAYGLLVIVNSLSVYHFIKTKNRGSKLFIIAVSFSAISALIYMHEWGISAWFNHFDISHIFMCISAIYFYKAASYILNHK